MCTSNLSSHYPRYHSRIKSTFSMLRRLCNFEIYAKKSFLLVNQLGMCTSYLSSHYPRYHSRIKSTFSMLKRLCNFEIYAKKSFYLSIKSLKATIKLPDSDFGVLSAPCNKMDWIENQRLFPRFNSFPSSSFFFAPYCRQPNGLK